MQGHTILTNEEARTVQAALNILSTKLQVENKGGVVFTTSPASPLRKAKSKPNQAAIDKIIERRRNKYKK